MKKILTTTALFIGLSSAAFAGSNHHNNNSSAGAVAGAASIQGQKQGQIGINKSENENKIKGSGNSDNSLAGGDVDIDFGDRTTIVKKKKVVKSAYAPVVISTSDCLGTISAGGQGQFLGLTFGKTTQSKPCNVREFAKMNIHDAELFYTIQCQDPIVREAYKVTGDYNRYCVGAKAKTRSKWYGLGSVKVYEDICAYPTEECKRYKKFN